MKRILIVDDEELIRESVSDLLQLKGYEVITAADGFLGLLEAFKNNPDLILLDVMMPKIDGYTFLARLRANPAFHLTPVIMLSAKAKLEDQRHGLDLGADDYLFKPFKSDELLHTIEVKLEKFEKIKQDLQVSSGLSVHNVYLKASHEVNTGLNGILGSVTVLKDFGQDLDDESRDELLGAIKKSALRIKRIFDNNRWLELIMSQKLGDPKSYFEKGTSLGVCIDKVLHDLEINDQINSQKLQFDKDVHDLSLNLPCEILQKILLEILDNAIKFSSKGGFIALKTREKSDSWLLEISDNSGGIQLESHDINLLFN